MRALRFVESHKISRRPIKGRTISHRREGMKTADFSRVSAWIMPVVRRYCLKNANKTTTKEAAGWQGGMSGRRGGCGVIHGRPPKSAMVEGRNGGIVARYVDERRIYCLFYVCSMRKMGREVQRVNGRRNHMNTAKRLSGAWWDGVLSTT